MPLKTSSGLAARRTAPRNATVGGWRWLRLLMLAWLLLAPPLARALDTAYTLAQYQHTVWTSRDGAPTNVIGLAVGQDGYLWLASPRGVWRFDGVEFAPARAIGALSLAQETVTALFGGPHGALLVDLAGGHGAVVVAGGRALRLPACTLTGGAIEVEGDTWLVCNGRIVRRVGDRVEPLGAAWNAPDGPITMLARDRQGTVWASTAARLSRWTPGTSGFRSWAGGRPVGSVAGAAGTLWSAESAGIALTHVTDRGPATAATRLQGHFSQLLVDRDGGFWAIDPERLVHVGDGPHWGSPSANAAPGADVMTPASGLGSDSLTALFEDDHGSVWLATAAGLERFKDNYFLPVKIPGRALSASIAPGDDGSIWAANYTGKLMQISNGAIRSFDAVDGGVTCLSRDRDGTVWVASEQGRLFQIRGEAIARAADIPAEIHGSAITDITKDVHGALWVGATINGVVGTYAQGRWTTPHGYGGLPDRWASRTVLADDRGRLWASRHYDVMRLENDVATRFSAAQGLEIGDIFALSQRGPRIWVGGSRGVAYFDGSRFQVVKPAVDNAFSEVTAVLETPSGDLWVHEFAAAVRVPAAELDRQRRDAGYRVQTERYDALDGLYGNAPELAARASMVQATDGRLWFSTSEGLAVADPKRPRPASYVPPVSVQGVVVDGVETDLLAPLVLQHSTKSVRFLYTAVSPSGAERLRFRYRLEGLDPAWTDAGSRRAITYNSLVPGDYRFRVESSDDRGNWAGNVTAFAFTVKPLWFETLSFRLVCVLAALLALWRAHDWRARRATRGVRLQMRVQQMARERIARDLHETLLQGMQALLWRLHGIAAGATEGDPVRGRLEATIGTTQGLIAESRFRVMELRRSRNVAPPLSETLKNVLAVAASLYPFAHSIEVVGDEVAVPEAVQVDICDIVREALTNSAQHGHAKSVGVEIAYSRKDLVVRVVDDGVGFDPEVARFGRPGHWGIIGMRERTRELGGSLLIQTEAGQGTEVALRLRARKAFQRHPAAWLPARALAFLRRATAARVRR